MNRRSPLIVTLSVIILSAALAAPVAADESRFPLTDAVPNDVFLCVAGQSTPELAFLDEYWGTVFEALDKCGIKDDVFALLGTVINSEQMAEVERLKTRAMQLMEGVDWQQVTGGEMVFAERMPVAVAHSRGAINMGAPDMVFLFRSDADNYAGLVAILEAIADEISKATGRDILALERATFMNSEVASLCLSGPWTARPAIELKMTAAGAEQLARFSRNNQGRTVAIVFDGKVLCAPHINSVVSEYAVITGAFGPAEARAMLRDITVAITDGRTAEAGHAPRLQCRLVARDEDSAPFDLLPDPEDPDSQPLRVLKDIALDESAVASARLNVASGGAPNISLSVARHGDVVAITFGDTILNETLSLLDGRGIKPALTSEPRFKAAFAALPPAQTSLVFFDAQALMASLRGIFDAVAGELQEKPEDMILNVSQRGQAVELSHEAVACCLRHDYEEGLRLMEQAHQTAPQDSRILYNLACAHALNGHREEALACLQKAVDGGFYAPQQISQDPDLQIIRGDPRYQAALAKAAQYVAKNYAHDTILNSTQRGEVHALNIKAWSAYDQQDYQRGLELVERAYEIAPEDSRVLYYLACFHALLGHPDKALDFLNRSVAGGFYCPHHITNDPDLESLRGDARYEAALVLARTRVTEVRAHGKNGPPALVLHILNGLMDAIGIVDYTAAVSSADGYTVRTDSIATLVPGAEQHAMYSVITKCDATASFDRYLPKETLSFTVSGGVDLKAVYAFVENLLREAGPTGDELLAMWEQLQKESGVNVQEDVLSWINGESVSVTLEDGQGSVWLMKVNDEQKAREKVSAAIEFLTARLPELIAKNPLLGMLTASTSPTMHEQLEGFQDLRFVMSPEPIVWGVADRRLIVGTSADAIALCLATARGEHPGIRENPRVMAEALVPAGSFVTVSLTDQRNLGNEIADAIGMISMVSGTASAFIPVPSMRPILAKITAMLGKLAPVARKIDFFKSTAAQTTFDGQMWHTQTLTHFVSREERGKGQTP